MELKLHTSRIKERRTKRNRHTKGVLRFVLVHFIGNLAVALIQLVVQADDVLVSVHAHTVLRLPRPEGLSHKSFSQLRLELEGGLI